MKLIENDCEYPLKLNTTILVDLGEDRWGDIHRYHIRIFSDDKEKRWFAIRAKHEGNPHFCFETSLKADAVEKAETALRQYHKYKRKRQ